MPSEKTENFILSEPPVRYESDFSEKSDARVWERQQSRDQVLDRDQDQDQATGTNPDIAASGLNAGYVPISSLRKAQRLWKNSSVHQRVKILRRFRKQIAEEVETWTQTVAAERQRCEVEVLTSEVLPFIEAIRYLEQNLKALLKPEKLGWRGRPLWLSLCHSEIRRDPLGVVLILAPSNYPLLLAGVQCIQALAAGNAVIWKPAERCSESAWLVQKGLEKAGIWPDLVSVIHPSLDSGKAALHAGPDHVVLTGSHSTGRSVIKTLSEESHFSTTFELSGCDAMYVRSDADLQMAARALGFGMRLNQGRTCIAPRRIFVHAEIAREWKLLVAEQIRSIPRQELTTDQDRLYREWIQSAVKDGASPIVGSCQGVDPITAPLLLDHGNVDMELAQNDVFAPVSLLISVRTDEEFLELQDQCNYRLGASIFSRDVAAAKRLAQKMNVGTVTINDLIAPTADPRIPFGGRGLSGHGVTRGKEGFLAMTQPKVITATRSKFRPHFDPVDPKMKAPLYRFVQWLHGSWIQFAKKDSHKPTR